MAFDILVRYLKNQDYKVKFVRNITDVDDKIIERAIQNNESIGDLTQRTIASMQEDFAQLGLVLPNTEPRATDYIPGMIEMIEGLIQKGHAYHSPVVMFFLQSELFLSMANYLIKILMI